MGFIYLITDLTSKKKYIGRKNYWLKNQRVGCKGSTPSDTRAVKFNWNCWNESDWREYSGSSPDLKKWMRKNQDHEYEYRIIKQCYNKGELAYSEVEEMVLRGVLWKRLSESGEYEYFNRQIPGIKFRVNYDGQYYLGEETN